MMTILHHQSTPDTTSKYAIGGKAANLYELKSLGCKVPPWVLIPHESLSALIPDDCWQQPGYEGVKAFIETYSFSEAWLNELAAYWPEPGVYWAVRSSALDEDGSQYSFAGQFESLLYVDRAGLAEAIRAVWLSAFSERVLQYRTHNGLSLQSGIAILMQEMVNAEVAGVAFGINPVDGDRQARVINAVFGLGEGLVSGELDADLYVVKDGQVSVQLANKTAQFVRSDAAAGTLCIPLDESLRHARTLTDEQALQIVHVLDVCLRHYGRPQDIEFAWAGGELYLLQARPVTNLHRLKDPHGAYILWDNSNIIESYPGVTTPLTFSFISQSYEGAYRLFCAFMGVSQSTINQHAEVFSNTLGLINGRVYYNLKTWYHMLAMLPGYSINARFMEKMMGVKERFDIPESYRLAKGRAILNIGLMLGQMYVRFLSLPRRRKNFMQLLETTIAAYKQIDYEQQNAHQLMTLYRAFEQKLLQEWKAPLLNDFFAMIWFGMLQKLCDKYGINRDNPNLHNDLLCGSSDIISTQPIHRTIRLASMVSDQAALKSLFVDNPEPHIWQQLCAAESGPRQALKKEIDHYLADFGERCIGELKLETVSYSQDPVRFIRILKSYVVQDITTASTNGQVEEQLRSRAEASWRSALRGRWLRQWRFKRTLRLARELVSSRENLRYDRTRAFGIVRQIFSQMGRCFYAEGILLDARDIFYLSKDEIFAFIEGRTLNQNLKALVALRQAEFAAYRDMPAPSERFASYGPVYHANDFFSTDKTLMPDGDLKGIGCCPGRVRARARVVLQPEGTSSLEGDILVTSSTDPGWVTLFPSASGIIVERGSLLSHSAIVSREMGKPCIVSVSGLLKTIQTGDEIEMDGSTGEIKIINKVR